jgi:NADPH2:quinone reductase
MRALQQTALTGPHAMQLITDAPVPAPGEGEILIRVGAAGVNFADVMQTRGTYAGGPHAPYIAGFEAAGEVVALGPGVTGFAPGDHVIGTGPGAFAEYMALPAAGAVPVPAGWTDAQSLGLVMNWATALAALRLGRVAAGETVLVQAAAGGVGQAAVRMARHYGATVIGTASPDKSSTTGTRRTGCCASPRAAAPTSCSSPRVGTRSVPRWRPRGGSPGGSSCTAWPAARPRSATGT